MSKIELPPMPDAWQARRIYAGDDPGPGVWHECSEEDAAKWKGRSDMEVRALYANPAQAERDAKDAARFAWYFGDKPKGEWLETYLDGIRAGWTLDQWRAAIDAAMTSEGKTE